MRKKSQLQTAHGVEVDENFGDDDTCVEQNEEVEQHLKWIAFENSQRLTAASIDTNKPIRMSSSQSSCDHWVLFGSC